MKSYLMSILNILEIDSRIEKELKVALKRGNTIEIRTRLEKDIKGQI